MTEPTQKSLDDARELRAALSLGRDEYDAFMLVEEAEFDCKIALALDAARQEGRSEGWNAAFHNVHLPKSASVNFNPAPPSRPQP